ncbi:hypothetical protein [Martelella limonii]|uniref:hypothetical protein n=1 Tax=Martelella limonii TaxID=1647649 RepID=UPI0015810A35|nr:hypothetical protein [Martelella limonii]
MSDKLSENQVHDLLFRCLALLSGKEGDTVLADTTVKAAHRALMLLSLGILKAQEEETQENEAIKARKPSEPD